MTSQVRSVAPLGEALHLLQMSGTFYCRSEFSEPWGLDVPPMTGCLMFHVVTSGRCWLEVQGASRQLLERGDLALLPHGEGHRLASEPAVETARLFDLSRERVSDRYEIIRHGGGGAPSVLICGAFRFDHPAGRQLLSQLPRLITVQRWSSPRAEWIQSTLHFIAEEARELRAGGETVITRLADILVIQAIRSWLEQDPAARTGWLRAVQDAEIGRAMSLIHRDPSRAWTVESLAVEVAMSRAAFAARFTELVGEPVMHYVTRWRMHIAMAWLKDGHGPLADVADRLGYRSEAAFSRAFKRITGMSPGAARRGIEGEKTAADTDAGRVAMMPEAHAGDPSAAASAALQSSQP